jgi:hypothetical protein
VDTRERAEASEGAAMTDVEIVSAVRTPIGTFSGGL